MIITINNRTINFKIVTVTFHKRDVENVFIAKNNKSLIETLQHGKYGKLYVSHADLYSNHHTSKLGKFLKTLKDSGDNNYNKFLNKYGDRKFCEFSIKENLKDKGIYSFIIGGQMMYVGRCTDNFNKRINQGYGKIHPKNCYIDGQATNCHINSLINLEEQVVLGLHIMSNSSTEEIKELEKLILANRVFPWNIQTK